MDTPNKISQVCHNKSPIDVGYHKRSISSIDWLFIKSIDYEGCYIAPMNESFSDVVDNTVPFISQRNILAL